LDVGEAMISKNQIEHEARRVLRRLSDPKTVLAALPETSKFGIFSSRNKWQRPVIQCAAEFVKEFEARELLVPIAKDHAASLAGAAPRFGLSSVGRAFLRRSMAGEDGFAGQHRVMEGRSLAEDGRTRRSVMVNVAETPLGWLRNRKDGDGKPLLSEAEYEAGERLREDFTKAGLTARVTADWSLAPGTAPKGGGARAGQLEMTDMALAARQRFFKAVEVAGPGLSDILIEVCCHLNGLEDTERSLGWPRRSAKLVLKIALTRLAGHYGLVPVERRRGRVRSWQAAG